MENGNETPGYKARKQQLADLMAELREARQARGNFRPGMKITGETDLEKRVNVAKSGLQRQKDYAGIKDDDDEN